MHGDYVSPGCIIRVSRCSKQLNFMIHDHQYYWKFLARKIQLKRFKSNQLLYMSIRNTQRCRECAISTTSKATLTNKRGFVFICKTCAAEKKGYNELVSREDIFKGRDLWSKKRRQILGRLFLARKTSNNKFLYWGFQWRNPMIVR